MENESAWGYPLWDDLVPTLPPASRLYHLPPEGLGTPESESLTSYVVRLATAHRVSVRSLVVTEIRPQLGPTAERATYLNRLVMFWRRDSATLNGTSGTAQAWVRALQTLTARTDLAGLTMLHWAQVVAAVGLVRLTRVWCPACYHDQQQGSGTIYDLRSVTVGLGAGHLVCAAPVSACRSLPAVQLHPTDARGPRTTGLLLTLRILVGSTTRQNEADRGRRGDSLGVVVDASGWQLGCCSSWGGATAPAGPDCPGCECAHGSDAVGTRSTVGPSHAFDRERRECLESWSPGTTVGKYGALECLSRPAAR